MDDDQDLRDLVCLVLESEGFETISAPDGRAALRQLRLGPKPDLIVLDLMMPEMNGWEFREEQLRQPDLATIPVLVATASRNLAQFPIDTDVLFKPFDTEQLISKVRGAFEEHGASAAPV